MGFDPVAPMFHPKLDRRLPSDVMTRFLGFNPLEFQNLLAFFEEEFPDRRISFGLRGRCNGLGLVGIGKVALEGFEGRDGKFQELGEFFRVVRRQWRQSRLREIFKEGDGEFAAFGNVMLGQPDEVTAAANAQIFGSIVNFCQHCFGQ